MEKDKLKLIVQNLELLVDALKAEVLSDVDSYRQRVMEDPHAFSSPPVDYDEVFEDDDG